MTTLKSINKEELAEIITNYPIDGTSAINAALAMLGYSEEECNSSIIYDGVLSEEDIMGYIDSDGNLINAEELADIFINHYMG